MQYDVINIIKSTQNIVHFHFRVYKMLMGRMRYQQRKTCKDCGDSKLPYITQWFVSIERKQKIYEKFSLIFIRYIRKYYVFRVWTEHRLWNNRKRLMDKWTTNCIIFKQLILLNSNFAFISLLCIDILIALSILAEHYNIICSSVMLVTLIPLRHLSALLTQRRRRQATAICCYYLSGPIFKLSS